MHLQLLAPSAGNPDVPGITDEEAAATARAIVPLFAHWQLSDAEAATLLGGVSQRSYQRWKAGDIGRLGPDLRARLSNLIGIHKALRIIFRDPARGYRWVRQPNTAFNGKSALDIMLEGNLTDLMRVRALLDAERGAW